jgi:porin
MDGCARCVFLSTALGTFLATANARAADFGLTWTGDFLAVTRGGLQRDARHLGALDLSLDSAFKLFGRHAAQLHAVLQNTYGGGLSEELIGDLQTASNIDADPATRLLELWVDVAPTDDWSLRLGKYDLNSEFDAIEPAALFLSSSQGVGPDLSQSGAAGPSLFPQTAFGVRFKQRLGNAASLRAAILDVESEPADDSSTVFGGGPMLALEYEQPTRGGIFKLGGWGYTRERPRIDRPQDSEHEYGAYLSLQHRLTESLEAYGRLGTANPSVDRIGVYAGGGIVSSAGLLPRRDDKLGFAIGYARNGNQWRDAAAAQSMATDAAEVALELTWQVALSEHVMLQPDLQYIINPDTNPALDDAIVAGVRIEVSFSSARDD